jgi:NAD(P)-dependent dehydrogenase (short-subunit alcohol dehydrogenase family)
MPVHSTAPERRRRRALVTGASRGLGFAFCEALLERGDDVFAACRTAAPELEAMGATLIAGVELTSEEAVGRLAGAVGAGGLDLLICNAGMNIDAPALADIDVGVLASMYDVNALGAVRAVLALLPALNDAVQAPSARDVARKLLARADELTVEDSPSWQQTPEGEPILLAPSQPARDGRPGP